MVAETLFSSNRLDWGTPRLFFDAINSVCQFELDAAANAENAKCNDYYGVQDNALNQPWYGRVWCNPPYGREIGKWLAKGLNEVQTGNASYIVWLLPARTDTNWFHAYIDCMLFLKKRLKFEGAKAGAPFPSLLAFFGNAPVLAIRDALKSKCAVDSLPRIPGIVHG